MSSTRRILLVLDEATRELRLASSAFLRGVRRLRVRSLSFKNTGDNRLISVVLQGFSASHSVLNDADGSSLEALSTLPLGPFNSTLIASNTSDLWDWTAHDSSLGETLSSLSVSILLDQIPASAFISSSNRVYVEFEFGF
jgi:hypothetical protein